MSFIKVFPFLINGKQLFHPSQLMVSIDLLHTLTSLLPSPILYVMCSIISLNDSPMAWFLSVAKRGMPVWRHSETFARHLLVAGLLEQDSAKRSTQFWAFSCPIRYRDLGRCFWEIFLLFGRWLREYSNLELVLLELITHRLML